MSIKLNKHMQIKNTIFIFKPWYDISLTFNKNNVLPTSNQMCSSVITPSYYLQPEQIQDSDGHVHGFNDIDDALGQNKIKSKCTGCRLTEDVYHVTPLIKWNMFCPMHYWWRLLDPFSCWTSWAILGESENGLKRT